jgi:hypothetical protein
MRRQLLLAVAVAEFSLAMIAPRVEAKAPAQGISLQISPLPIILSTKPGTSAETDLRVRNAGSEPEQLQVHLLAVKEDDNGQVHLTEPQASDDWVHWVSFSPRQFNAPPGQWQTTHMTVTVPTSAAFGYYFAVEFQRTSEAQPQPGQTAARGAVATFVLLNADVPGAKRQAEVVSFTADHRTYEFLPATLTVKIRSTGNVHVAPHGNVFITRGSQQVGSIAINASEGNVLPGGGRFFTASWSDGFPYYETKTGPDGQPLLTNNGEPQQHLVWNFAAVNRLRIGRYTARLVMVYDDGQRDVPLEAEVSFWVIPWRLLAVLGTVVVFAGLGMGATFWRLGRLIVRRGKRKSKDRRGTSDAV